MRNMHVISHTHWDREWYRPFQLFRLQLVHLVDGMLDILEKDPGFKYFMLDGQTIVLDDYLLMRPENEMVLREHIRKGRILIGPWHILPDMFLVGPEAHIRNLLQGDRTARNYGPKMMVGYMPDSFGHIGQIPQILHGFGIESASLWRGVHDGPAEFWWQAPDGSRILMAYLREGYGNGADLPAENIERFASMLAEKGEMLSKASATSDLLIMYGTDHMEPPQNTSEAIAYADEMLRNTRVIHSTLPQYVAAIQSEIKREIIELPTMVGELRACKRMHLLPGVLSTRMWIKQRNHGCETLLTKWAEPFSTFATLVSIGDQPGTLLKRPSAIVRQAWHILMENHPHDSICGCSIDQVHEEMKVRFDQVDQIGEEITRQALECLAAAVKTERELRDPGIVPSLLNDRSCIVVFNPSSTTRTDTVTAFLKLPPNDHDIELVDENGNTVPFQLEGNDSHTIIQVTLSANGLRSAFGNINDGRAAGMTVQNIKIQHKGSEVFIDVIMANGGEPNLAAWKTARNLVEGYLSDSSISAYHVCARSPSTTRIIATIADVPGLGYRTFWVHTRSKEEKKTNLFNSLFRALIPLGRVPSPQLLSKHKGSTKPPHKIENDFFIVEAQKNGTLTIEDKRSNITYRGLNRFLDGGDCGDEYNYSPPLGDQLIAPRLKQARITRGPVQQTLDLELELIIPLTLSPDRKSRSKKLTTVTITTTITLSKGVPRVDIRTLIANCARDHRLRVHFPAPFKTDVGSYDGHFEVVNRPVALPAYDSTWVEQPRPEVPQRAYSSISDGISGLTIANRGLPEVEVLKNSAGNAELSITLLRCIGWLSRDDFSTRNGHAGPFLETPEAQMPGTWKYDYSIIPNTGDWTKTYDQAYAFEAPMCLIETSLHHGKLPTSCSFVQVKPGTFVISTVKKCENGAGWLVRGYNITSEDIFVTLIPWKQFRKVEIINLAEEKQKVLRPGKDGSISFPVRGHEIVTVRFDD
jgi:mannosylglycerate hydrolase